jgi:hypothetical protein
LAACAPIASTTDEPAAPNALTGEDGGPKKHALVMGGGVKGLDEPVDYFTDDFIQAHDKLGATGFDVRALFGDPANPLPAAAQGLARMAEVYGGVPDAFTIDNYRREMQHLVDVANAGDEIVLVVSDHGYPEDPTDENASWPKETDVVPMYVLLGAPLSTPLDFDTFIPYRDAIEQKGASITLFFFTCDAGWSMTYATTKTCVVSESGFDKADGWFAKAMWPIFEAGLSPEALYDAAVPRQQYPDDDPRLSSRMGHPVAPCEQFVF